MYEHGICKLVYHIVKLQPIEPTYKQGESQEVWIHPIKVLTVFRSRHYNTTVVITLCLYSTVIPLLFNTVYTMCNNYCSIKVSRAKRSLTFRVYPFF